MNTSTNTPDIFDKLFHDTAVGGFWHSTPVAVHVAIIIALAFGVHLLVKLVHFITEWLVRKHSSPKLSFGFVAEKPKFVTLIHLIASAATFVLYFLTVGVILISVFHFNDTFFKTYLSSAAVLGLALSFGLQGLVQDVVTGVTLILSNAIEVGDVVDLSGVIGRVELIGLRFTKVINFYNQEIFVPNRNIANVARFPQGGVYAYADVQFSTQLDRDQVAALVREVADGVWTQFGAIIISQPEISEPQLAAPGGWGYLRIQFKIWPGQTLIETAFRPQMVSAMKRFDANYADWMVPVTYRAISSRKDKAAIGEGMKQPAPVKAGQVDRCVI